MTTMPADLAPARPSIVPWPPSDDNSERETARAALWGSVDTSTPDSDADLAARVVAMVGHVAQATDDAAVAVRAVADHATATGALNVRAWNRAQSALAFARSASEHAAVAVTATDPMTRNAYPDPARTVDRVATMAERDASRADDHTAQALALIHDAITA